MTAQVSEFGWKALDRYQDKKVGCKFIEDPVKVKELKELDKEYKEGYGGLSKKSFQKQSYPVYNTPKRPRSRSPLQDKSWDRVRRRSRTPEY